MSLHLVSASVLIVISIVSGMLAVSPCDMIHPAATPVERSSYIELQKIDSLVDIGDCMSVIRLAGVVRLDSFDAGYVLYRCGCPDKGNELMKAYLSAHRDDYDARRVYAVLMREQGEIKESYLKLWKLATEDTSSLTVCEAGIAAFKLWEKTSESAYLKEAITRFRTLDSCLERMPLWAWTTEKPLLVRGGIYRRDGTASLCIDIAPVKSDIMLYKIQPIVYYENGDVAYGKPIGIEEIAEIYGSPYLPAYGGFYKGKMCFWADVPPQMGELWLLLSFTDSTGREDSLVAERFGILPRNRGLSLGLRAIRSGASVARAESIYAAFDGLPPRLRNLFFRLSKLAGRKDWSSALSLIDTLNQPKSADYYLVKGSFLMELGDSVSAERTFAEAIAIDSLNYLARYDWGIALFLLGHYDKSCEAMRSAEAVAPFFAPSYLAEGILYMDYLDKPDMAISAFRRYLELSNFRLEEVEHWIDELEK